MMTGILPMNGTMSTPAASMGAMGVDRSTARDETARDETAPMRSFAEFYAAEFERSVQLARALTGSWDVARDVTQDAFCGMHRKWLGIKQPEAYLRRSIVNGSTSHHRRRLRDRSRPALVLEPMELGAHELTDALAALPSRQRAALVLRHHLDLPDADIADALGVKVGTVASLVHRGLASLRVALSDPPVSSPAASAAVSHPPSPSPISSFEDTP